MNYFPMVNIVAVLWWLWCLPLETPGVAAAYALTVRLVPATG